MNLKATIEYLDSGIEAIVDMFEEDSEKWVCTENISLKDTLPTEVVKIKERYGDRAALHKFGLIRFHLKAKYLKRSLGRFVELN